MLGLPWVPRLRGTAALQVREDHWSLEQNLEGVRSRGAVLVDPSFVCLNKASANVGPSLGSAAARDRSPRSGRTIGALIKTSRAFRSRGAVLVDPSFVCLSKPWANVGPSLGSAAARDRSPGQEDHSSLDQDLEGVRSRAAVLVDPSFVCRNKGWANVGPSLGSAAARDCSPPGQGGPLEP